MYCTSLENPNQLQFAGMLVRSEAASLRNVIPSLITPVVIELISVGGPYSYFDTVTAQASEQHLPHILDEFDHLESHLDAVVRVHWICIGHTRHAVVAIT